ncbi:hypothetical protein N3K66_002973 [Trichothecium roseum]|uniref:Uncharacterized protein n=1 Tax=Trichothecium roseum TaxID=47278 RepID=A0ACC0V430_9HYPO|nr:hypothetical protein N3K66_002973 [Trichothecium roseum]
MADTTTTREDKLKAPEPDRDATTPSPTPRDEDEPRFTAEEEAELLSESDALRQEANALFATSPSQALSSYEQALSVLPTYTFHLARAVLHSNMAAAHLRLEAWPEAATASTAALDLLSELERSVPGLVEPPPSSPDQDQDKPKDSSSSSNSNSDAQASKNTTTTTTTTAPEKRRQENDAASKDDAADDDDNVEEEIISTGAEKAQKARREELSPLRADVLRIRAKSHLRRGRARSSKPGAGWHDLSSALEEDYKPLSAGALNACLTPADRRAVAAQLAALQPRVKEAQDREVGDMWDKLKGLGDGLLKPFGMSTDNFKMVKDEATGSYSVNFSQN